MRPGMRLLVVTLPLLTGLCRGEAYLGYLMGPFTDTVPGIGGFMYAVDKSSIIIKNFTFNGSDPGTFIYAGTLNTDGSYTKTGYPLTNQHGVVEPVDTNTAQLLLQFPEGKSLFDVDWIGVLSRRSKKMVGRVLVTDVMKMNIPKPQTLGRLQGRGAMSGDVLAIDSQTVLIRDLIYSGNQPETFFMVGTGSRPSPYGEQIPNEGGSMESLGTYKNRTIILTLPPSVSIFSISWLSIWSQSLQSSFSDIEIPRQLNVPPAATTLGITPQLHIVDGKPSGTDDVPSADYQDMKVASLVNMANMVTKDESKLNCEVLSSSIGLEVRWSVAQENIILQIVGNLGSDMYMAFGVKDLTKPGAPAQGDVVVGWINTQTGKGGLDDYFLSGAHACSDGAESCPDTTKPGGQKNVEMLNSVSRDNYTMLTFKRPLAAEDLYDTTIRTSQPQEVFWSVGYKKAEMRMKHKPLKNKDPIFIDFGRLSSWNCPTDSDSIQNVNEVEQGERNYGTVKTSPATKAPYKDMANRRPNTESSSTSLTDKAEVDDLDSEPSINLRRKFKGKRRKVAKKEPIRRFDYNLDQENTYTDDYKSDDYDYDLGNSQLGYRPEPLSRDPDLMPSRGENAFSPQEIANMKQKFEEKLKKDFPKRRDGQKTTLELIPELNTFVEPFFPKRPPPGALPPPGMSPPQPPPGPATHPPTPSDENWTVPSLGCNTTDNTVFYLQIGPAAARRGNQGLGQDGQAWYVNGDVAPDLYLVKGQKYTFIVEGGLGTDQEGTIHPFYLTSDNEGGYGTKSDYEAKMEEVYGGLSLDRDGLPAPSIMGRLCQWKSPRAPATYANYQDFKGDLKVDCQETGNPGVLRFKADYDMPNLMYYQSFSEKFLGGKIHLMDQCHETLKSSAVVTKNRKPQKTANANGNINYNRNTTPRSFQTIQNSYQTTSRSYKTTPNYKRKLYQKKKNTSPNHQITKTKSQKKCPRKLDVGMPQFEHFPVKEILKEGVDNDCQDASYDDFDDWNLEEQSTDKDYEDYVQPTRKPLVFKERLNKRPLSGPSQENNYDYSRDHYRNNEVNNRKDQGSTGYIKNEEMYDQIPDLPPPELFPNLFSNLPAAYGEEDGFMSSYKTDSSVQPISFNSKLVPGRIEKISQSTTYKPKNYQNKSPSPSSSYKSPSLYQNRDRDTSGNTNIDIDILNSGNSGMSVVPPSNKRNRDHTTHRETYTTPKQSYTTPRPSYTSPKHHYKSPSPHSSYTPMPKSNSPYEFYSPKPLRPKDRNKPKIDTDSSSLPAPLPPPGNFPSFFNTKNMKEERKKTEKRKYSAPPPVAPVSPPRQNPLQTFLNPFKNIFSLGNRKPQNPPAHQQNNNRRNYYEDNKDEKRQHQRNKNAESVDDVSSVPAPLPPPIDFPEFYDSKSSFPSGKRIKQEDQRQESDMNSGQPYNFETNQQERNMMEHRGEGGRRPDGLRRPDGGRRRRKRPRRPLIDDSIKYQYEEDINNEYKPKDKILFKDLLEFKKPTRSQENQYQYRDYPKQQEPDIYMPSRRPLFEKRPYRNYGDQQYSPSESDETIEETKTSKPKLIKLPVSSLKSSKKYEPSSLGIGVFNPGGIVSESGFTPLLPTNGNAPSLAFSIFDDMTTGTGSSMSISGFEHGGMMDRMDSFHGIDTDQGDRGNVVVDIPAQVLPYHHSIQRSLLIPKTTSVPARPFYSRNSIMDIETADDKDPWEDLIKKNTGSGIKHTNTKTKPEYKTSMENSADFHSFENIAYNDNLKIRKVHDIQLHPDQLQSEGPLLLSVGSSLSYGPQQSNGASVAVGSVGKPEYLNAQMLTAPDGTSLAYGNHAPYGKQHPSYVQQEVQTRVGSSGMKKLDTSSDVVYGKVSETPTAPLNAIKKVDERLLEKLSLLEESSGKEKVEDIVTDLWSIMKQNGG